MTDQAFVRIKAGLEDALAGRVVEHQRPKPRDWTYDQDEDSWVTDCGDRFTLNDGTPEQNAMRFCCFCGKPLREIANAA